MNQHHMINIHVFLLHLTPVLLQNAHVLFVIMTMGAMHVVKVTYRIYHMSFYQRLSAMFQTHRMEPHGSLAGDAPNKAVREEADLAVKAVFSHLDNLFAFLTTDG